MTVPTYTCGDGNNQIISASTYTNASELSFILVLALILHDTRILFQVGQNH
jgi:hypothetical protein